jgi:peptidoglycan/xylan/chitin deacetylase (PgdA/CDA1 family)
MDHAHYPWMPLPGRPKLTWPNGAPLALCVLVALEHFEPRGAIQHSEYSRREYGNRIGIFRLMDVMDRLGVRGTAAMDVRTATYSPYLVHACTSRGWEIMAHGLAGNQLITSEMSEDQERAYIGETLERMTGLTGTRPVGWLGAEFGESQRTPVLLAERGVRYVCDWPNDEQPYVMTVPNGSLVSVPMLLELDDVYSIEQRHITTSRWAQTVDEAADVLSADGADNARLLVLSLHPWIMGQPHRIKTFEELLRRLVARGAWLTTGREIANVI